MSAPAVPADRPNPLAKAAQVAASLATALHSVLGAGVALGLLTAAQSEVLGTTGAALPGWLLALGTVAGAVFPALAAIQSAFATAKTARPDVTPMADPRSNAGLPLVTVARAADAVLDGTVDASVDGSVDASVEA